MHMLKGRELYQIERTCPRLLMCAMREALSIAAYSPICTSSGSVMIGSAPAQTHAHVSAAIKPLLSAYQLLSRLLGGATKALLRARLLLSAAAGFNVRYEAAAAGADKKKRCRQLLWTRYYSYCVSGIRMYTSQYSGTYLLLPHLLLPLEEPSLLPIQGHMRHMLLKKQ